HALHRPRPRRPPSPPLFPYTTLFRSRELPILSGNHPGPPVENPPHLRLLRHVDVRPGHRPDEGVHTGGIPPSRQECNLHRSSSLDRKSTRLNSSHVKISYAVFCLKQK